MNNDKKTEPAPEPIIAIKNLSKNFGDKVVLDKITLDIREGQTTVVIGPSGCGKTVLIKHLICLLRPTSGEVYFKNQRIDNISESKLNKIRIHFGFLFQGGALFDCSTALTSMRISSFQYSNITR
ncbi:MAG: ATP-binding cassette domain-containing protein [Planctomycetota bacterium]|jgi:phospholipid/cholesterol/gamma-HCH transport system ATP-binding protein